MPGVPGQSKSPSEETIAGVGFVKTVTVIVSEDMQPSASAAITIYSPETVGFSANVDPVSGPVQT